MLFKKPDIKQLIVQGKDKEVLNLLYKTVLPKIRNHVIQNQGTREEADDVFQDSVLYFYKKYKDGTLNNLENIEGYIYLSCKNLWINKVKKDSRNIKLENGQDFESYENDSLSVLINEEKVYAFKKLFEIVGEKCKQMLLYTIYDKLSMEEIAVKMNISSANAAKTQHYRCKQRLIELVENDQFLKTTLKV